MKNIPLILLLIGSSVYQTEAVHKLPTEEELDDMLKHSKKTLDAALSNDPKQVEKLANVVIQGKRDKALGKEEDKKNEDKILKNKAVEMMEAITHGGKKQLDKK